MIRQWILGSWHQQKLQNFFKTEIKFSPLLSLAASNFFDTKDDRADNQQCYLEDNHYGWSFDQSSTIKVNRTSPGMFDNIPGDVPLHSPECLVIFPGMFEDIPRNVWWNSPDCLTTFPGIFDDIPRNVGRHFPECLSTFPWMFGDIPRNVGFLEATTHNTAW